MGASEVRIQGLSRDFSGRAVFRPAWLDWRGPGILVLRGRNGSGKTTFLRVLATLAAPSSGDASVAGFSVVREPERVRERVGYVPASDGGFFSRLTGSENLAFFGAFRGLRRRDVEQVAGAWSEILPALRDALATPFSVASAGMKQSLALCRALLSDPAILLLDEPTRSLDAESALALHNAFLALRSEKTLLLASHQPQEWALADEIWEMGDGALRSARSRGRRPWETREDATDAVVTERL